ncbi:MAG: glutamate--cysteine ligase [Deltaproteobacteria bacterium]|nr:MAG: glutamate--cysteine ligase [Deltaproteobacteria bacterium]TMB31400.1 MAG: glutamate--cysteine ligase [Deltaproteobacteria bacterium]
MSLDLKGPAGLLEPIRGRDQLLEYFRGAEKPRSDFRVGVEHEKIGVVEETLAAVPYYGEAGIRTILDALARDAGGMQHQHKENGQPIAVLSNDASVTLEPGGQLELSGAPTRSQHEAAAEIARHIWVLERESKKRGICWLAAGYRPFGTRDEVPWMPKGRYAAMRKSLGPRGRLALDMMLMTATVQTNLDFSDERDMAEKARTSTAISPVVTAMFANSPIVAGKPSSFLDFRYQVWRECDPARCGLLEPMLQDGFGYEAYTEWALDVPMLFVRRGAEYLDSQGQTFRDWMRSGRLRSAEILEPLMGNWVDHLTTLFPEVRIKGVVELRGADVVPPPYLHALSALWVGLLYDVQARGAAWELTRRWSFAELVDFQGEVARKALDARGPDRRTAREIARTVLSLAREGLGRWAQESGDDARDLLDPLEDILDKGTLAERALAAFREGSEDPRALLSFWKIA